MAVKTSDELRVELRASEARNQDILNTYQSFVLWVVDKLKPSGILPPLTDEAYAKQLVEGIILEKDAVQKAFKHAEDAWVTEKKVLLENEHKLKRRISEMGQEIEALRNEFKDLKIDMSTHSGKIAEAVKDKTFLNTIRSLFARRVYGR